MGDKNKKRKNNDRNTRSNKRLKKYKIESSSSEESETEQEPDQEDLDDEEALYNFIEKLVEEANGDISFSLEDVDVEEKDNKYNDYLKKLSKNKRDKLLKLEDKLLKFNSHDVPLRYKILESDMEEKIKSQILQKAIHFESLTPMQSEYFKIKKYMDGVMNIPFGKFSKLPIKKGDNLPKIQNFIQNIKNKLDECIYGQNLAKQNLLQVICKWITNPASTGNVIGLCGPPGIGKTSIIKNGLSKALNMPFSFLTLGGATNASVLEGFDFTYEGSKCGRIVEILMDIFLVLILIYPKLL